MKSLTAVALFLGGATEIWTKKWTRGCDSRTFVGCTGAAPYANQTFIAGRFRLREDGDSRRRSSGDRIYRASVQYTAPAPLPGANAYPGPPQGRLSPRWTTLCIWSRA